MLERQPCATRRQPAEAILEGIQARYNSRRRHSSLGNLSPIDYERPYPRPPPRPDHHRRAVPEPRGGSEFEARVWIPNFVKCDRSG
ncbi:IS3 family transposase [Micromonospora chersina]|uniref:IS3 family transposase n=1 Tax=Micromonospora chersina TaxID=47854 RepID=UPI003721B102